MNTRFAFVLLFAGLVGVALGTIHAVARAYASADATPTTIRVPYAIVEQTLRAERSSLVPVTLLGIARPEDGWAVSYGVFNSLDDCIAELGDIAYLYREKWPMMIMWCAPGVEPVAIPRPQPRPKNM